MVPFQNILVCSFTLGVNAVVVECEVEAPGDRESALKRALFNCSDFRFLLRRILQIITSSLQ
jgi:hypothetical protein